MERERQVDIVVEDAGGIVLLEPWTSAAQDWLGEYIGRDNGYQPYWPTVVVERGYAGDIIEGMITSGLTVVSV